MSPRQDLKISLNTDQRMALFGRLRMAHWLEMPETEFASEIEKIEKDPLFKKLYFGEADSAGIIRRQRWPRGGYASGLFEVNERTMASGERVEVEELLGDKKELVPLIRKLGRESFEKYFLYAEEPLPLKEISKRTGVLIEDIQRINELLVEIGAQEEFAGPRRQEGGRSYVCLARFSIEEGETSFEFYSPYWARGLYQIRYDLVEEWKSDGRLQKEEVRKLPHLLKRMETVNLRQNTMFRIIESLAKLQADFLKSSHTEVKRPISLRMLAHRLDLAPSTVSRALHGRAVKMPWGKDIPLIELLPGRRNVLRDIMSHWLETDASSTDAKLALRLREECGIRISRRTVNAVRNELLHKTS